VKYINDFIDKDNNLDFLSKKFFVSKYYLCHTFKKYTGVSIHSYINHKRVIYAKQLIDEGETASGAAYRVGFGDYSAFYRAYVKILGVPPTKEIRKTREVNNSKACEEE
jgi:AraC-like DNA-binding protein